MALDLDKIKQNLLSDKLKGEVQGKFAKWGGAARSPKLAEFKAGVRDIKNVLAEGKFTLFLKQFIVLAVVFLLVRAVNGKLSARKTELKNSITAISMQQTSKEDYLNNKDHLLRLEPLFPDIEKKSDWMPSTLMALFGNHDLAPKLDGNFAENEQKTYTVVSQNLSWQQSYENLGKMMADMENGDAFLRVSEVSISKLVGPEDLGNNNVTVKFNTVFPKAKYASKLFKDYKQQMDKIQAQQKTVTTTAATNTEGAK